MDNSITEVIAGGAAVITVFIFIGFLKWAVTQFKEVVSSIVEGHQMGMNGLNETLKSIDLTQKESNRINLKNAEVAEKAIKVSEESIKQSKENYDFMRNLNGELKKAYDRKRS
jgi:hypothetical protein